MTLTPILNASPIIQLHIATALIAIALGPVVLLRKKGTPLHKLFGRLWVLDMLAVAISSFWIKSNGQFSWIHLLSLWIALSLPAAVVFIRLGNVRVHQRIMVGGYIGLVVAGVFTALPSRILGQAAFGA
jgi:uncharacterized membrane protein